MYFQFFFYVQVPIKVEIVQFITLLIGKYLKHKTDNTVFHCVLPYATHLKKIGYT